MTIKRRLQFANMVFRAMVKHRIIERNPFGDVSIKASMDKGRQHFITADETKRLVECAPNWEWRTIIGLCRFAGARCLSEVLTLRWENVDWERNRIRLTSPKTEYHPGKESRLIPRFPTIRPFLEEAFELVPDGTEFVIADDKYRKAAQGPAGWRNCNLRMQFKRIIQRDGLKPWPRLFHNLRSSLETSLAERFPAHVIADWMGHSVQVATRHYLQTTNEHFERAIQLGAAGGAETRNRKTQTFLNAGFRKGMRKLTRSYQLAKRMGRDSNPRYGFPYSSFQDCRLRPLGHPSGRISQALTNSSVTVGALSNRIDGRSACSISVRLTAFTVSPRYSGIRWGRPR